MHIQSCKQGTNHTMWRIQAIKLNQSWEQGNVWRISHCSEVVKLCSIVVGKKVEFFIGKVSYIIDPFKFNEQPNSGNWIRATGVTLHFGESSKFGLLLIPRAFYKYNSTSNIICFPRQGKFSIHRTDGRLGDGPVISLKFKVRKEFGILNWAFFLLCQYLVSFHCQDLQLPG